MMHEQAAARVETFFERYLRHSKGIWAGSRFELLSWQRQAVREIFGTLRPDGLRQYRTAFIGLPRKNGKSSFAAGVALYMLLADGEPGAEVYSCAADKQQAAIVFQQAADMVRASPALRKRCRVYRRAIEVPSTGSIYRVLSSDAPHQHGLNASAVIFDELHAQPDRELWDVMTTSMGARRQPLMLAITTAGWDSDSICREVWNYAEAVKAGTIKDDSFYSLVFAADPEDRWDDPATWRKANPSLGVTVTEEYLAQEAEKARHSPAYQNTFRRLYLNQWTQQETRWLDLDRWDASAGVVDPGALVGQECYGGLDLSTTTDLTAFALLFPQRDGSYMVLPEFWVPGDTAARADKRDRVPYTAWARDGYLHLTPGNVVDYQAVAARIKELSGRYRIREIAYDRWNASALVQQLQEDGATMVPTGMGFASMSAPAKELEALMLQKKLHHGGHPVLRWCAANVAVEMDAAGNIKPSKAKSTERIDGIVATILALSRAMLHRHAHPYEERGVLVL